MFCMLQRGDLVRNIYKHEKYKNTVVVGSRWNQISKDNFNINTYGNILINYLFNLLYYHHE